MLLKPLPTGDMERVVMRVIAYPLGMPKSREPYQPTRSVRLISLKRLGTSHCIPSEFQASSNLDRTSFSLGGLVISSDRFVSIPARLVLAALFVLPALESDSIY